MANLNPNDIAPALESITRHALSTFERIGIGCTVLDARSDGMTWKALVKETGLSEYKLRKYMKLAISYRQVLTSRPIEIANKGFHIPQFLTLPEGRTFEPFPVDKYNMYVYPPPET